MLDRLRAKELRGDPGARVDDVMEAGPTTIRPDQTLESIADRMGKRHVTSIVETLPNGQLVGVLFLADVERRLESFQAAPIP